MHFLPFLLSMLLSFSIQSRTIELTPTNHILLKGTVDANSVNDAIVELLDKSAKLDKSATITLVLDTPGGSVPAGLDLIDVINSIPQRVDCIALFAASMGFSILQACDHRLATKTSIIMQHRGSISLQGTFHEGEVESRLNLYKQIMEELDVQNAERVQLPLKAFKAKVRNEWWILGVHAIKEKVVDGMVEVSCSKELIKTKKKIKVGGFFGVQEVEISGCPLVR